jgi:hypothetical protein
MGMRNFLFTAWFTAAICSVGMLARYDNKPGVAAANVRSWPSDTLVPAAAEKRLVFFLHPQCPCSQASLEELRQLLSRCQAPVATTVLAFSPADDPERWRDAAGCKTAASIPGVTLQMDPGGSEAKRFGATTSGHVAIFDSGGQLLFTGGITGGRAMVGDNAGFSAALAALTRKEPLVPAPGMPVYGCAILPAGRPQTNP